MQPSSSSRIGLSTYSAHSTTSISTLRRTAAASDFILRVLLADGGDDDEDDDDDADDGVKGRPVHSVPSVRFEQGNDNDADNNGGGGASAD